jgi:DNA-binding SARP family transcriptional activator/tetratricopeptide (TPR) repeat protein
VAGMEFGLLGPLSVRRGGMEMPVPPGKQRVLLAALLLRAGRVVALDDLAEALWGARPPATARVTLQNYVMRLRRTLGDASRDRIATHPGGYLIHVTARELDVPRFEALLATAQAAARDGSWDDAAGQAGAALALWRGEPLEDVASELLAAREVPRLAELRLQALEMRIEAAVRLGRQSGVIAELRQLAGAYPLRERLHGLLMLALYRDGRQGEALAAYQNARTVLVEELGTEPGVELHELHQRMLTADPMLRAPAPARAAPAGPAPVVPRELPAGIRHFTGRGGELKKLTALLDQADQETPTVVISAIGGTAGVGKTALAVQWAHQVAQRFPDGQLYVNLRGYDPGQPVTAADALAGFLRALGVPGPGIPAGEDERAARYRSLLAGKRLLVVADNAGSVEQVRPLLPGSPACVVVVTSRDTLAGLVARDGARRLDLDLLPLPEAVGLLRALIGERVDDDPGAAAVLAAQCARLPLALRVAAEFAAARPDVGLAGLSGELAGQRRLDLLDAGGDPRTAVRAVLSWSHRHLDRDAARAFRLAGLHPGADFDRYAVAALTGTTVEQAGRLLDVLARAHLIHLAGPGRYGLHDLLRAYARELAASHGGEDEQHAALTRLFDHYLHTAATAMDTLHPAECHRRPRIPLPATPAPPVTGPAAARAWLDAERATLVAVTVHTAGHGWPAHATRLAATLFRYLDSGSHYPEAITIHTHARDAARHAGDRSAEATALNHLAGPHRRQGRYQQAIRQYRQALALFQQTGDRAGQAHALGNLGNVCADQGRYQAAIGLHEQALDLYRQIGDRVGEARTLGNLGYIEERQGRYRQAAGHHRQSLAIARETGNRTTECIALINLGTVDLRQDRYQQAAGHLHRALALCRETGYRFFEAEALTRISGVRLRQGRLQEATGHLEAALALYGETGNRSGKADALNTLGEVLLATGQPGHARTQYTTALGLAGRIGDKYQQARAHNGLGHAYYATGNIGQARSRWQEALTLYTELGAPEADQVRAQLTAADGAESGEPDRPAGRSG